MGGSRVARFKTGESWWLDRDQEYLLAQPEQQQRYQVDAWQELIQNYLQCKTQSVQNGFGEWKDYPSPRLEPLADVTISEILEHAIGLDKARWVTNRTKSHCSLPDSFGFRAVSRQSQQPAAMAIS